MGKLSDGRRFFCAEFKLEAVRRMEERRAQGVSLTQVGRELDVRPDMLRAWKRQRDERAGAARRTCFRTRVGCRARRTRCGGSSTSWPARSRRSPF
jgi:transposase-like protein